MDIVRKHLSLLKVILIILEVIALFLLFGDQLIIEGNSFTFTEVFFKGNNEISSSPIGLVGYLFIILPLFIETFSLILLLSKNKDFYKNDILAMDIASILFSAIPITLISLMPYFSKSNAKLTTVSIFTLVILGLTILVLIYFVILDILIVKYNTQESYSNFINKYTRLFTRFMNIFRAGLSITMIVGGVTTLSAVSMAFFPQVELEDGTSLTLNEIYTYAVDSGAIFPFFIYIAYPLLLISCLLMIIIPIRTFGKISKDPEKKKIKTWEYITIVILSLTSIISVSLLPKMVTGSSLTGYAISMISLASSGLVIAARKLVFSLVMSIPRFVVNDLPKFKVWIKEVDLKYFTLSSLVISIIGLFIVLVPITNVSLYISIGILVLGLLISIIINSLLYKREKRVVGSIVNLVINVLTLSLSLIIEFIVLGSTNLSISLLLLDIVSFLVVILSVISITLEGLRTKRLKKEALKAS